METNIKTISQHKYPHVQTAEQRTSQNTSIPNGRPLSHLNIPNDRCSRSNRRILSDHRSFVKQIHKLTLHTHRCTTYRYLVPFMITPTNALMLIIIIIIIKKNSSHQTSVPCTRSIHRLQENTTKTKKEKRTNRKRYPLTTNQSIKLIKQSFNYYMK